jgi:hypothetical protein
MEQEDFDNVVACANKQTKCRWQMPVDVLQCVESALGNCNIPNILEAEESAFHDGNLVEATRAIKEILAGIPCDPNGRSLSFVHTNMGTLLAWVEHGGTPIEGAVSSDHDDDAVTAALKLKL